MNNKNVRHLVYLASNHEGLDLERHEIIKLMAQQGMLNIGLPCRSDASPYSWEVSRSLIESADLFVLLVGDDYGPMLPTGISYLHREFVHAKALNKPILAFLKNSVSQGGLLTEDQRRLASFHRVITSQSAFKLWHLREELLLHAKSALSSNMLTIGPGWAPVNKANLQAEIKPKSKPAIASTRQRQAVSREMLNLHVTSKVYQGGNLTLTESYVPSRIDQIYNLLLDLLKQGASEDRLRKRIEMSIADAVKKEQLAKHPQAHAVDDIRLSRSQFQQILKSWHDAELVQYSGTGSRLVWKLP